MPTLGGQTATVITRTPGAKDRFGIPTSVETSVAVTGCFLQPLETEENLGNIDTVVSHFKLFAPAGTPLTPTGRVVVDGVSYEVRGDPMPWSDIRGIPHHIECYLRRATG